MDHSSLFESLLSVLRRRDTATARELGQALGKSQPTVSRALAAAGERVVRIGRARRSRYAATRNVRGQGCRWPLYRLDAAGRATRFGQLTALHGGASLLAVSSPVAWLRGEFADGLFPGLPWFLDDMRPQGFLGRQFAHRFADELGACRTYGIESENSTARGQIFDDSPADSGSIGQEAAEIWTVQADLQPVLHKSGRLLRLADDIDHWGEDAVLLALLLRGDDVPGSFVLGEAALRRVLDSQAQAIPGSEREQHYGQLAAAAMAGDAVGSSAAGEQPKFTACVDDGRQRRHVIVKFTEPLAGNPAASRWADLLICEHQAACLLAEHGVAAAATGLVHAGGRLCLESTRFDRIGARGRRGVVTLAAWSDAHDGIRDNWAGAAERMQGDGWISAAALDEVRLRWWFGRLIGNSDMHFGNLAFFLDDGLPLALAPSYDMLPMRYRPSAGGAIHDAALAVPSPLPEQTGIWIRAAQLAQQYWGTVAGLDSLTAGFRVLARANAQAIRVARRRFF